MRERRNVDTKHSPPRNHGFPQKYPTTVLQIVSEEEHRCNDLIDIHGTGARQPPWRKHISAATPIRWDGKHISAARPHTGRRHGHGPVSETAGAPMQQRLPSSASRANNTTILHESECNQEGVSP